MITYKYNNSSDNNNFSINRIINDILDKKILEILKQINNVYPDKFPKKKIKLEFEFIRSNIKLEHLVINSNKIPKHTPLEKISLQKTLINDKTKQTDDKCNKKCNVESRNRCNARIWNNIYDRNTLKEVSDIDKKFKVKDFIDIKIKEFHSKYIVGTQCRRAKSEGSIYCYQHKNHCTHGNYFEIPSEELCLHFMKDGNYL